MAGYPKPRISAEKNKIPLGVKLGYGIGTLSSAVPLQMVSSFFLFYCTIVLGISGTLTGLIISLSTVWDALTDPPMGYISDHTSRKIFFGRRLFYVFIGAIGIALANYLLWHVDPQLRGGDEGTVKVIWVAALLILLKTFSTVYATPYLAFGAELSSDYNERNAVQSFRTAFLFIGLLFPSVLGMTFFFQPTAAYPDGKMNPEGYATLGLIASVLTLACAAVCLLLTYKHRVTQTIPKVRRNPVIGIVKEFLETLKVSDFRNVGLALLFINTAMGFLSAVGMHLFTYTFGFGSRQIALIFGSLFLAALAAQPVWVAIANRYEKSVALRFSLYINLAVSAMLVVYVLESSWLAGSYLAILPLAILMGFSMGGGIALPYSMISDTIDKDAYESGTRKEGMFYGCATLMFKVSQSLAVLIAGVALDLAGFDSRIAQAHSVYVKVGMILPMGFFVCFTLALVFARQYKLNREMVLHYQAGYRSKSGKF
jgi:Na+/melibiose symporter-like transporter